MTAEEKARQFSQIFALLDSEQPGEREAALGKLHALRVKMGWPSFGDVLRKLESTVTPEQFEAVERDLVQCKRTLDERAEDNADLARRNAALSARIASLRAALWFSINWKRLAAAGVVLSLGYGGWRWSNAEASPDSPPSAAAPDSEHAAADAAFRDVLNRTKWTTGDTPPAVWHVNGVDYWVVVRGTVDASSHADARGRPIERHCLQLYASEAVTDAGSYLTPSPYLAAGWWMKWPQHAAECRMPGKGNYG
jgi:hypothetical protein